jgi:hypothetical protein
MGKKLFILILFLMIPLPVYALGTLIDSLSMTWDHFDSFVMLGQCGTVAPDFQTFPCHSSSAVRSSIESKSSRIQTGVFLTATDTIFNLVSALQNAQPSSSFLQQIFSQYNYSQFIFNSEIFYADTYFTLGVRPKKITGSLQTHNPNLPLASVVLRDETDVYSSLGFNFNIGALEFSFGGTLTVLTRSESLAEATLLDIAASDLTQLVQTQRMNGIFSEFGINSLLKGVFSISGLVQDMGVFWLGTDTSSQYLFISPDRIPRITLSAAWIPYFLNGQFRIGMQYIYLFSNSFSLSQDWTGTVSYFLGPLAILTGFCPGLFRSGINLNINQFSVSVAQEWINQVETGRQNQPRFIVGASYSL